jgi:hypothetical protein
LSDPGGIEQGRSPDGSAGKGIAHLEPVDPPAGLQVFGQRGVAGTLQGPLLLGGLAIVEGVDQNIGVDEDPTPDARLRLRRVLA